MTYKNGYLPSSALITVQGSLQLRTDTAAAWFAMKAAAAKDGITLTLAGPAGAYRTWATQLDMRAHPARYNITPGIVSGLPSEHGLGICVDIASGLAWVKKNGSRFGFTFPLKTDPNHARYDGTTTAGQTGTPITEDEENEMKILNNLHAIDGQDKKLGNVYFSGPGGIKWIKDPNDLSLLSRYIDIVQNGATDTMYTSQIAVVNFYLQPDPVSIDVAGIAASVSATVKSAITASGVTVDSKVIASAVDSALADNFAAIPGAVRAAIIK